MIEFVDGDQGDEIWHQMRLGTCGGSSMSDLLAGGAGKTRKKLMYRLAAEIISGQPTPTYKSAAMEEGTRREQESRDFLAFHLGEEIDTCAIIKNDDIPGVHYSPDGFNREKGFLVELKNPLGSTQAALLDDGKIQKSYRDQMALGLLVSGLERCYFCSYVPNMPPFIRVVERDENALDDMSKKIEVFYGELMELVEKIK